MRNNPDGCIGWCTYGKGADYQLYELLGDSIAQIHYKKYKCICFVDNASGLFFDAGEKIKQNVSQAIKIDVPMIIMVLHHLLSLQIRIYLLIKTLKSHIIQPCL